MGTPATMWSVGVVAGWFGSAVRAAAIASAVCVLVPDGASTFVMLCVSSMWALGMYCATIALTCVATIEPMLKLGMTVTVAEAGRFFASSAAADHPLVPIRIRCPLLTARSRTAFDTS